MPQIQELNNPYENVMAQAAQGISGLTNAATELEKRRAMRWQTIKDLNGRIGRLARENFEKEAGYTPSLLDQIVDSLSSRGSKGLATLSAKPSSAIERAGASVTPPPASTPVAGPDRNAHLGMARPGIAAQQKLEVAPSGPDRNAHLGIAGPDRNAHLGWARPAIAAQQEASAPSGFDPNRVSESTLKMLGGDEKTLARGNVQMGPADTVIDHTANGDRYYMRGIGETDKESYESAMDEADGGYKEWDQEYENNMAKLRKPNSGVTEEARRKRLAVAATVNAMSARTGGRITDRPAERTHTDITRASGPVVYKDPVAPAQAVQPPAQQVAVQPPAQQVAGGVSSSASYSRSGNPVFWNQNGVLTADMREALEATIPDYATPTEAYATMRSEAEGISDQDIRAAAMRYIEDRFPQQMSSYDNGVIHKRESERVSGAQRQWSGGGDGGGNGDFENGYLMVNGVWKPVVRLKNGDPADKRLFALASAFYGASEPKSVIEAVKKIKALYANGDDVAKELIGIANSQNGSNLVTSRLYSREESKQQGDITKGLSIPDLSKMFSYVDSAKEWVDEDLSDAGIFGEGNFIKGQIYPASKITAGLGVLAKRNKNKKPSETKKGK